MNAIHARVGFIGLGVMGSRMAANLQKAGYRLVVHDRLKSAAEPLLAGGAEWAGTPRDVASKVELVMLSLPGPPQVEEVVFGENGLAEGLRPGFTCIDFSTNSAET